MAPGLEYDAGLGDGVAHRAPFADGQREGLLAVNVLSRLASFDHGDGVPVVGRAYFDGVDILATEDFVVIDVRVATLRDARRVVLAVVLLDQALGGLATAELAVPVAEALAVDVANGDDLDAIILEERPDVVEALVAGSNHAEGDPVARRDVAV